VPSRVVSNTRVLSSSASFVAVVLATWPVLASERAPFFLTYAAPLACPDREAWLAELSRRSSRAVLVGEGENAPTLSVQLTELADRVRAELVAVDVDGSETRRTVYAPTCVDAVEGSAWIAAVWLDPSVLEPPPPPAAAPPGPPPTENAVAPTERPQQAARDRPVFQSSNGSARATPVRIEASVMLGSFMTALPETPLGFGAFLGVAAWPETVFAPVLRWGYVAAGDGTNETERGDVRVSLGTARGLGCVFAWKTDLVTLRPCTLFELGSIAGSGQNTTLPATETVAWRSVGVLGRGELRLNSILSLEAEAGLVFPLSRDRFVFGPAPPVVGFEAPAVTGTISLGLSVGTSVGGPISGGK